MTKYKYCLIKDMRDSKINVFKFDVEKPNCGMWVTNNGILTAESPVFTPRSYAYSWKKWCQEYSGGSSQIYLDEFDTIEELLEKYPELIGS